MGNGFDSWGFVRKLTWQDILLILVIALLARLLVHLVRGAVRHAAEHGSSRLRLTILRVSPILRVLIDAVALAAIIPILVEPTFENVLALFAAMALTLAFALKDYASSLVAGLVTVLENTYQPGDWIEVDGTYGEVKSIGMRAVHIVTPDDTEVVIPHSRLWSASVFNASGGKRSMLCVAEFHLHPDHDAGRARKLLTDAAEASPHREPGTGVVVVVFEKPWGTLYRVKVYAHESREQFLLISDVTVRAKQALRAGGIPLAQAFPAVPTKI